VFADPVPAAIGAGHDHQAEQHQRAGGYAAAWHGGRKTQRRLAVHAFRLGAETAGNFVAGQAERGGVGAHETQRIGGAGQVGDAAGFDQAIEQGFEPARGFRQHGLFVEAGDDDGEDGSRH